MNSSPQTAKKVMASIRRQIAKGDRPTVRSIAADVGLSVSPTHGSVLYLLDTGELTEWCGIVLPTDVVELIRKQVAR